MQAIDHVRVGSAASAFTRLRGRIATLAVRLCSDLAGATRDRRVLHRLATLSDRELKDIGLWRQDVHDAGLMENGDVSRFLVDRRDARRVARDAFRRGRPSR